MSNPNDQSPGGYPLEEFRHVVLRYLQGQDSLDTASTAFASLWHEWAGRGAVRDSSGEALADASFRLWSLGDLKPDLSGPEAEKIEELIAAALAKLP